MSTAATNPFVRLGGLKSLAEFRDLCTALGVELPAEDTGDGPSPLSVPVATAVNGKFAGNRIVIHPMEGWDGSNTGDVTDDVRRRWRRFGESGAKLIYGGEAMAVRPDGRANPQQLLIDAEHRGGLSELVGIVRTAHAERYGRSDDLVIGFQLTHSGRFCRPHDKRRYVPRVAYRHPLLDRKFGVTSDAQVLTDVEVEELIGCYVRAARVAWDAGADFVDLKHCHGYLLHEFLGAHTRPGRYGGSFENRTRILREIISGMRADGNPIDVGVRLSVFDLVPFRPDPTRAPPGKLGPGIPEDVTGCLPYRFGFGVDPTDPTRADLSEAHAFTALCRSLNIKLLNATAGSPYYNPHIQRPAAYPPSDGYQPPQDPLIDVARQIHAVRDLRARAPAELLLIGTGYSYLQEFLGPVATAVLRRGWADMIGIGRAVLSYPEMLTDAAAGRAPDKKRVCRTFSDCTTAPRNGLVSGCYPLDHHYKERPEFQQLKELKRSAAE